VPTIRISPAAALAAAVAAVFVSVRAPSAAAALIGFDEHPHGRVIDTQYHAEHGLRIEGHNWRGGPDYALSFDTRLTGTADPDLEDPFDAGNLSLANLGSALIIAENMVDANGDSLIDSPDDQSTRVGQGAAGQFVFRFDAMQTWFGFDLIDIDGPSELTSVVGYVSFMRWGVEKARVSLADLTNLSSTHYDPTIAFGDNSANRVSPFTAAELGMTGFNGVAIAVASGAVDNVTFGTGDSIPEPAALALAAPAACALLARRRRATGC